MSGAPRAPLDRAALGRMLTRIADTGSEAAWDGLVELPARGARRIGLTGAPGTGKSSLLRALAAASLAQGRRVGAIAVDPSSPHSHGAILGDRIRMGEVTSHPEFFFRSLASRNAHDGLADNLADILHAMECYDFDDLYVETVGVGQAEFGVSALVDCVVLVLMPESGDHIQAMKAGVIEIAGVIVVNKADLPGARRTAADVQDVFARRGSQADRWTPPVVLASQDEPASQQAVAQAIEAHFLWHREREDDTARRRARAAYHVQSLLKRRIDKLVSELPPEVLDAPLQALHGEVAMRLLADIDARRLTQRANSRMSKPE